MIAGRLANRKRKGYGKLSTHWRTGYSGKTSSTSSAALCGHAPRAAARAEPTVFAAERQQMLGVAGIATYPQKAVLQTAASQIVLELPLHVVR